LNSYYENLHYYQNALQTPSPNTGFTQRLYSMHTAHPQRAHGALEYPTALQQRPHSTLSNTQCKRQAAAFVLSMFKINAAAWRSWRLHSVFTAFPQRCWRLQLFLTLWERCFIFYKTINKTTMFKYTPQTVIINQLSLNKSYIGSGKL